MSEPRDGRYERTSLFTAVQETLLRPVHILTSRSALRTYIHTLLLCLTSISLLALAVLAYTSFYYAYIPIKGIDVPVYLQYPQHSIWQFEPCERRDNLKGHWHPYAVANIAKDGKEGGEVLMARQKYDVWVEIEVPRSKHNLQLGNWMVGLDLRGPGEPLLNNLGKKLGFTEEADVDDYSCGGNAGSLRDNEREEEGKGAGESTRTSVMEESGTTVLLARSRRPAILTYRSPFTEMAYRLLRLPLYVMGWGQESETVKLKMMEDVEFEKGPANAPKTLRLDVRDKSSVVEVYSVKVQFVAKLGGLRYIMYTHRLSSLLIFTTLFWTLEITVLLMTWGIITFIFSQSNPQIKPELPPLTPKTEPASDGSSISPSTTPSTDASHTFPTLSSQQPLHYSSTERRRQRRGEASETTRIKQESVTPVLEDVPIKPEEADDEDDSEDADFLLDDPGPVGLSHDSGIGTSLESSAGGPSGRRRSSAGGGGGGGGGVVRRRSGGSSRDGGRG